jgi:hypothetical protein
MRNFLKIGQVAVGHIQQVLWTNSDLWNKHSFRKTYPNTPHSQMDDIWLRFLPEVSEGKMLDPSNTATVWFDEAKILGECCKGVVLDLMRATNAYQLDRLLITRLAPGNSIRRHNDRGMAYTALAGIARYHLVIQGLPGSMFYCGDEEVNMKTGEIWWFNALEDHSVCNNSVADRIHMLIDLRTWL